MIGLTREQLLEIVDDIREGIATGDSSEGYLNYVIPDPDELGPIDLGSIVAMVEARYRIGNADGSQGGMRMLGVNVQ